MSDKYTRLMGTPKKKPAPKRKSVAKTVVRRSGGSFSRHHDGTVWIDGEVTEPPEEEGS